MKNLLRSSDNLGESTSLWITCVHLLRISISNYILHAGSIIIATPLQLSLDSNSYYITGILTSSHTIHIHKTGSVCVLIPMYNGSRLV